MQNPGHKISGMTRLPEVLNQHHTNKLEEITMDLRKIVFAAMAMTVQPALAEDVKFSTNLHEKFQAKACTQCHDFHDKERKGFYYNTHVSRRDVNRCSTCHTQDVTGFEHAHEWFAMPSLYMSGMDAKTTCETIKKSFHPEFKSDALQAQQMQTHLLTDPRVLWGIEGATPKSGNLPFGKKEPGMVKGGIDEWKSQVTAWISGGMKCD